MLENLESFKIESMMNDIRDAVPLSYKTALHREESAGLQSHGFGSHAECRAC